MNTLFDLADVTKTFGTGSGRVKSLDAVSISIGEGQAVGLVGESGSGKTTLIQCALLLTAPDSGRIVFDGTDMSRAGRDQLRRFRREVQLVFQDPFSSLNPRMTVSQLVGEGLIIHGIEPNAARRRDRVAEMLTMVGLRPDDMERYPNSFSGGQRQRIAIARALCIRPRLLVCDEPVSALDVSVQAQVINLLKDMQKALGLTILFVAHDLAVVRHLCSQVHVINRGQIVESGTRDQVFDHPNHPYTQALLAAVSIPDPRLRQRRPARAAGTGTSQTGGSR